MNRDPIEGTPIATHFFLRLHNDESGCSLQRETEQQCRQFALVNEAIKAAIESIGGTSGEITVVDEHNVEIMTIRTAQGPGLMAA